LLPENVDVLLATVEIKILLRRHCATRQQSNRSNSHSGSHCTSPDPSTKANAQSAQYLKRFDYITCRLARLNPLPFSLERIAVPDRIRAALNQIGGIDGQSLSFVCFAKTKSISSSTP
jgi:hypothetical protein